MRGSCGHSWRVVLLLTSFILISSVDNHDRSHDHSPVTTKVHCETTKGPLTIEVHKDWAPLGAQRFVDLVKDGFFTDIAFFRCVKRFLTQFGISDKENMKHWHEKTILDDPSLNMGIQKNYVSFAGGGANSRSTQIFIAFEYLDFLGIAPWETPFGVVVEGQSTLDNLYKEYGDIPPFGKGPDQQKIHNRGNSYIHDNFPHTDFLQNCKVIEEVASQMFIHPNYEKEEKEKEAKVAEERKDREEKGKNDEEKNPDEGENGVDPDEEEEEEEDAPGRRELSDEEEQNKIPRGPDELDRLSSYERKARYKRGGKSLREQLIKSQEKKIIYDNNANTPSDKKARAAMIAVGLMVFLLGVLYYLHLQRAATAAVGKRS